MKSRRKTCDSMVFYFPEEIVASLQDNCDEVSYCGKILKLNFCDDAIQQINIFKEVHKIILQSQIESSKLYLDTLSCMFYQAQQNSLQKKTLNRIFLDLHDQMKEPVNLVLRNNLNFFMHFYLENISLQQIIKSTNCLIGLLENFKIGPFIIEEEIATVWKCLFTITDYLASIFNPNCDELNSANQAVLKVIILILQKCENIKHLLKHVNDIHNDHCQKIKDFIMILLEDDGTNLNCRLNAGIAYCYYICCNSKSAKENLFGNEDYSLQLLEKYSQPSQLCILSGIMAVMPAELFVMPCKNGILSERILHRIIGISESTEDSDLLLLCTRNLIQWSNVMCTILKLDNKIIQDCVLRETKKMFSEEGIRIDVLFKYILLYREHYIDTLRHLSKDLFKNLLILHILSIDTEPQKSSLLKKLTLFLLNELPEYNQGKYGLLCCIIDILGSNVVLEWCSTLPKILYCISGESSLISHISEVLESLYRKYIGDEENFCHVWLKPLVDYLCSDSNSTVIEHILPKLFKVRESSLKFLLDELTEIWEQNRGHCFSALITCVKLHQRQKIHKNAIDCISVVSLKKALCHGDDQVRLSAFGLICENQKTTEPILTETFELIKYSLEYNINRQSPSFRQQLVAFLKKLFNRMNESQYSFERKLLSEEEISSCSILQSSYKDFIKWMIDFLYKSLCPGANFPRRVTALNVLFLVYSMFSKSYFSDQCMTETLAAQTLIFSLQDTYENNKLLALNILSSHYTSIELFQNEIFLQTALEASLILASSTKPPDTVTAAYMFSLLVKCEVFNSVALKYVSKQILQGFTLLPLKDISPIELENSTSLSTTLLLSGELLKNHAIAEKSLLEASAHAPIYGILTCLRNVLSQVNYDLIIAKNSLSIWSSAIKELILLSIKLITLVEPVVCNSSPEGHLPLDTTSDNIMQLQATVRKAIGRRFQSAIIKVDDQSTDSDTIALDMIKTHAVTAQVLLLCCWRTHKEVSLLFGELCEKIPIKNEKDVGDILEISQVVHIGEYFIHQMTLVKHRGAFEQAYVGFGKLCYSLWRSNIGTLKELPSRWLKDLILAIMGVKENIHLCSTRRSAGLPFIVQAILTSEPRLSHSLFFKQTTKAFLSMAFIKSEEESSDVEVHALNIMRSLFRDACLSEVLVPFVSEAMMVSIIGFKSKSWAVRNSSTLLFSALLNRVFGVSEKSNGETARKNRLTGKTFFHYYKDTYTFLKDELKYCVSHLKEDPNNVTKVPTLYPILLVLGRLYPAPGESDLRLSSFLPYLQTCAVSPVWKTRVLAAKALIPLISAESMISVLTSLFESLPSFENQNYSQNKVHGTLLQILYVLQEFVNHLNLIMSGLSEKLQIWLMKYCHISFSCNRCFSTRIVFLEIILLSMGMNVYLDFNKGKEMIENLKRELENYSTGIDKDRYLSLAVTVSLFHSMQVQNAILLKETKGNSLSDSVSSLFLYFLESYNEIVKSTTLQILIWFLQFNDLQDEDMPNMPSEVIFLEGIAASSVHCLIARNHKLYLDLFSNSQLNLCIMKMLESEYNNPSCFGKVCQLSYHLPQIIEFKWDFIHKKFSYHLFNKLDYLLSFLKIYKRDEIANSVFLLASQIFLNICKNLGDDNKNADFQFMKKEEYLICLEEWFQFIKQSADPGNSITKRRTVACILQNMCQNSIFNNSKMFGEKALYLWETLLYLLIDDEPEIKHMAANIVVMIKTIDTPGSQELSIVPGKAIKIMLEMFLKSDIFSIPDYIGIFINWMLQSDAESFDNMCDEQPFDKGELNVFAEDLLLSSLVSEQLSAYLAGQTKLSKKINLVSVDRISCWNVLCDKSNDYSFDIDSVIMTCSSDICTVLKNIETRGAIFFLLDMHLSMDVLKLCQNLYTITCLIPWMNCLENYKSQALDIVSKIRNLNINIYVLEVLVLKFNEFLITLKS